MKIIDIAIGELGYYEKYSNSQLDSKTANAGKNNYTKYGEWYGMNGQPWCEMFVSWCAEQAGEVDAIGKFAYVPYHVSFFKRRGEWKEKGTYTPVCGDVIFFGDEEHVGLVVSCNGSTLKTIEGNTNQGCVKYNWYNIASSYIMGYGHPAYKNQLQQETKLADGITTEKYKNGSTPEPVYADCYCTAKIGELNKYETCTKIGTLNGKTIVLYSVDDTEDNYKIGFVVYEGD